MRRPPVETTRFSRLTTATRPKIDCRDKPGNDGGGWSREELTVNSIMPALAE